MFYHVKELQYQAKPERPDPVYAKKLQEIIGGAHGEITVAMQYFFQGLNAREEKYKDLLLDTAMEEFAHVEMIATMIARLLDKAPVQHQDEFVSKDPLVAAVLGGMNPQHYIVSGLGAQPADAVGYPWNARYVDASGNLLADFRSNLTKESHGRLQAVRLYEATTDRGVRDMLSWLIARDTMHQNQWLAAISEIEEREGRVVPNTFPRQLEKREVSYAFLISPAGKRAPLEDGRKDLPQMALDNSSMSLNLFLLVRSLYYPLLLLIHITLYLFYRKNRCRVNRP